jgi:hypothetical protein
VGSSDWRKLVLKLQRSMQGSILTNKAHRFELSFAETEMDVVAQLTDFPNLFSTASSLLDVVAQLTLTRQPTCTEEISKQYTSLSFHYFAHHLRYKPNRVTTRQRNRTERKLRWRAHLFAGTTARRGTARRGVASRPWTSLLTRGAAKTAVPSGQNRLQNSQPRLGGDLPGFV